MLFGLTTLSRWYESQLRFSTVIFSHSFIGIGEKAIGYSSKMGIKCNRGFSFMGSSRKMRGEGAVARESDPFSRGRIGFDRMCERCDSVSWLVSRPRKKQTAMLSANNTNTPAMAMVPFT